MTRFLTLATALLLAATVCRAQSICDDPRQFLASPTWVAFTRTVDEHYLAPRSLSVTELSPVQLAKILGHALGRQAHHVGNDPDRRMLFECLRAAAAAALMDGVDLLARLGGQPADATELDLLETTLSDSALGFYDDEVLALTGVTPDHEIVSVLDESVTSPGQSRLETGSAPTSVMTPRKSQERHACRFNIDPDLYTDSKPDREWALISRPWRGGFYYESWSIDPDWPSDHRKQIHNRLKPGQEVVVKGSKQDILRRVDQLQLSCK